MPLDSQQWQRFSTYLKLLGALGVAGVVGTGMLSALKMYKGEEGLIPARRKIKYNITFDDTYYGGRVFGEALKNQGVKFVFTLTGGHIAPILVGCKANGIKVIDVRHEVNTAFAADAISRLTGVPGVAIVTAGPGLTNTITAVKNAQMAQSPLILIGGATSDLLKGRGSLQDIDQVALLKPHVKWYTHISSIKDIVPAVEKAFKIAQQGVPGPVFIEVPLDTLYPEKVTREFYSKETNNTGSLMARVVSWYFRRHVSKIFSDKQIPVAEPLNFYVPSHSSSQVSKAIDYLKRAKKPVIMVGSQAMLLNELVASKKLTEAINLLGVPTFLTGMARGVLGRDSKAQFRHKDTRRKALREADVVILAGVTCDFRLDYGRTINRNATVISINRSCEDLYKNRTPTFGINADPAAFLYELCTKYPRSVNADWNPWIAELRSKETERDEQIAKDCLVPGENISPLFLCQAIEKLAGENAVIIADGGDFVGTAAYILKPRSPLSWMDPGAFGTLGVGCGFAMGAKLCKPDSEVWIIFGDGACGFSLMEFDTFVRHNIPVIAVVGNDSAWTQIMRDQVTFLKDDVGCVLAPTDYQDVVKGMGAEGILIKNTNEVEDALKKAKELAKTKPVLINAIIRKTDFRSGSLSM